MPLRISDAVKLGPFRVRVSKPLTGRGCTWASIGTRTPFGWVKMSEPLGKTQRGRRRR